VAFQQPGLAKVEKDVLSGFPSVTRCGDCQADGIFWQDLDGSFGDTCSVTEQRQEQSHQEGDSVEAGGSVKVIPRSQQGVAVEVEEGAEKDGGDEVE
jgi:hypothetical protein